MSNVRVRPSNSVDNASTSTYGEGHEGSAEEAVAALCHGFSRILGASPRQPARVRLDHGESSLEVEWDQRGSVAATASTDDEGEAGRVDGAERHAVTSPLVGVFYRAPEPDAPAFISVGDVVEEGQQLALVEAMKLFNSITSDRAGRVVEITATDGEAVEYGQELVVLELVEGGVSSGVEGEAV